jgi:hypothetical protein
MSLNLFLFQLTLTHRHTILCVWHRGIYIARWFEYCITELDNLRAERSFFFFFFLQHRGLNSGSTSCATIPALFCEGSFFRLGLEEILSQAGFKP